MARTISNSNSKYKPKCTGTVCALVILEAARAGPATRACAHSGPLRSFPVHCKATDPPTTRRLLEGK